MSLVPLSFTGYFFWYRIEGWGNWYRFAGNFEGAVSACRTYFQWFEKYQRDIAVELSLGDKPGEKPQGRIYRRPADHQVVFEDIDGQSFVIGGKRGPNASR